MIDRSEYLNRLLDDGERRGSVRIVTGCRGCGKSTLLAAYAQRLTQRGVPPAQVISIDFEQGKYRLVRNAKGLGELLGQRMPAEQNCCLILDEIQHVDGWEQQINAIVASGRADVVIAQSSGFALSSKVLALLHVKVVEIPMMPLVYREILAANPAETEEARQQLLRDHLFAGGMPAVIARTDKPNAVLAGMLSSIILYDIVEKHMVRDSALLMSVLVYLAENVGNVTSACAICGYLSDIHKGASPKTIEGYLDVLQDAHLIYRVRRLDIRLQAMLRNKYKFYFVDEGLRRAILGDFDTEIDAQTETLVYHKLISDGWSVAIGKLGCYEVDFVARKGKETWYIQVASANNDGMDFSVDVRPLRSLINLKNRIYVTPNTESKKNDGIKVVSPIDFLTKNT